MTDESAEAKLARVETVLDTLLEEVRGLRGGLASIGERLTRLEEATRETIPQVWPLRERVTQLELEIAELRSRQAALQAECNAQRQTTGSRWWRLVEMALSPAIAAGVMWLILRRV
jgi:phage shock protein A